MSIHQQPQSLRSEERQVQAGPSGARPLTKPQHLRSPSGARAEGQVSLQNPPGQSVNLAHSQVHVSWLGNLFLQSHGHVVEDGVGVESLHLSAFRTSKRLHLALTKIT